MGARRLSYCGEQVRRHDRDRYLCALFAPAAARQALFALYAFNIEIARVRELVSEAALGRIRLEWWREALDAVAAGAPPRHEVAQALARAVEAFQLPHAALAALIEAREFDLLDQPPRSCC